MGYREDKQAEIARLREANMLVRNQLFAAQQRVKELEEHRDMAAWCVAGAAKCGYVSANQRHALAFAFEHLTGVPPLLAQVLIERVPRTKREVDAKKKEADRSSDTRLDARPLSDYWVGEGAGDS